MDGATAELSRMNNEDDAKHAPSGESAPREPSGEITPVRVIEALLFATDAPLPAAKVAQLVGVGDARDVRRHIAELNEAYERTGRSFRVEEIAGGFQMLTLPEFNAWLSKLLRARQDSKLSQASLETLAIVAYKQPVTRADIEAIRGVAAGDLLNRLRELNLVKIVGRAEDLGRPLLYGTTKHFLEVFGLGSLEDLPKVEVLREGLRGAGSHAVSPDPHTASMVGGLESLQANDDAAPRAAGDEASIAEPRD